MKTAFRLFLGACVLTLGATQASATSFDFGVLGEGTVGSSTLVNNGVTATGYANYGAGYVAATLWERNQTNDRGLGVCSANEPLANCTFEGDYSELSSLANPELIKLDKGVATAWTSLWVSSLDLSGSLSHESGVLSWSNNADPNAAKLGSFVFTAGDFGAGVQEGNILSLAAAAGFLPTAQYVFFTPNAANGGANGNNDYLVWKGTTQDAVPEPASLLLLGTGLLGAVRARRKSK